MPSDRTPPGGHREDRPWPVRAAVGIALAEAAVITVYALVFIVSVFPLRDPWLARLGFDLGVLAFLLGAAVALAAAGRALWRCRHWPRSFLLVAQLMFAAVGVPMVQGGSAAGWALLGAAVGGVVLLLHPDVTAAIDRTPA